MKESILSAPTTIKKPSLTIDTQIASPITITMQERAAARTSSVIQNLQHCESPDLPLDSPNSTLHLYFTMRSEPSTAIRFVEAVTPDGFSPPLGHYSWTTLPKLVTRSQSCSTTPSLLKLPLKRCASA